MVRGGGSHRPALLLFRFMTSDARTLAWVSHCERKRSAQRERAPEHGDRNEIEEKGSAARRRGARFVTPPRDGIRRFLPAGVPRRSHPERAYVRHPNPVAVRVRYDAF